METGGKGTMEYWNYEVLNMRNILLEIKISVI